MDFLHDWKHISKKPKVLQLGLDIRVLLHVIFREKIAEAVFPIPAVCCNMTCLEL